VAANRRVEAGPFASQEDAEAAAVWMERNVRGVNPEPWHPVHTAKGLLIGSRVKASSPEPSE
jgi:hypothetical protein